MPKDAKIAGEIEKIRERANDITERLDTLIDMRMGEIVRGMEKHNRVKAIAEVMLSFYFKRLIKKSMEFIPYNKNQSVHKKFSECLELMDDLMLGGKSTISVFDREKLFNSVVVPWLKSCFEMCGKTKEFTELDVFTLRALKQEIKKMFLEIKGM